MSADMIFSPPLTISFFSIADGTGGDTGVGEEIHLITESFST
jgi:hypothetical protein